MAKKKIRLVKQKLQTIKMYAEDDEEAKDYPSSSSVNTDIGINMTLQLDKINPKFRELVDLLFFSDRLDIDLSKFKELLKENYGAHSDYLWDRFQKALSIFWENSSSFWFSRLSFLLSLNDKMLTKRMDTILEKRWREIIRIKADVDIRYDIEYLQFNEYCKAKCSRKECLANVRAYLTEMPSHIKIEKLISIIHSFIPMVFADIEEYVDVMSKKVVNSTRNYDLLIALEAQGVPFNKKSIIVLAKELMLDRERKIKNCRAFFSLLNDSDIRAALKADYNPSYRGKVLDLVQVSDFRLIEDSHLRNIKNLIDLDEGLADELAIIYADKLYNRTVSHKHANPDRLIRLLRTIPQISQRKILVYLSSNNLMADIKYVLSAFPDLKKLAAFV